VSKLIERYKTTFEIAKKLNRGTPQRRGLGVSPGQVEDILHRYFHGERMFHVRKDEPENNIIRIRPIKFN
jgi:hypothetical protein